jgi:adenylate kinase
MNINVGNSVLENAVLESDEKVIQKVYGKIYVFCGYPGAGKDHHTLQSICGSKALFDWSLFFFLGKGTCGEIISKRLGVAHISTGDLFRREVALLTPAGQEIASYMAKGQFVPPELANSILANRLAQEDAQRGVLLDGFPRSIEHLHDLDEILKPSNRKVEAAILLDIDEGICLKRLSSRRHCPQCLRSYNIHSSPPREPNQCDDCGNAIIQRADDAEEIIKKRFALAKSSLSPLLVELAQRDNLFTLKISESHNSATSPEQLTPLIVANKVIEIMAYPQRFYAPRHLTACYRLSLHLDTLFSSASSAEAETEKLRNLCLAYRNQILTENSSKRTGLMRRFVYLSSENSQKYLEFVRVFDRYGIEVLQFPPLPDDLSHWSPLMIEFVHILLSCKTTSLIPLAILRESSILLKPSIEPSLLNGISDIFQVGVDSPPFDGSLISNLSVRSSGRHGVHANHFSILTSLWIPATGSHANKLCGKFYSHITKGRIQDPGVMAMSTSSSTSPPLQSNTLHMYPVFGWDDKFILLETNESYHRHRERGLKISSRDMVLSLFLQDRIYYKHLLNLKHSPLSLTRPVDFRADVAVFVAKKEFYQTSYFKLFGLHNLLTHVLNEGIFFKGADTRLEANYWQPGLNAGLPLIAKKDTVHEITFMFHDFGHFLMKDLIYTGVNTSLHRHVYMIHRMMSESITIMLADGLFVHSLKSQATMMQNCLQTRSDDPDAASLNGLKDYDFTARKIYPLFCALWGCDLNEEQEVFPTFQELREEDGSGSKLIAVHGNKEKFLKKLKEILKASVDYTVKGDDRSFKQLLQQNLHRLNAKAYAQTEKTQTEDEEKSINSSKEESGQSTSAPVSPSVSVSYSKALSDYKAKYKPFFVSDFNWTAHNYENMSSRSLEMRLWWELTQPVRKLFDLPLETIDEFIQHLSEDNRTMNPPPPQEQQHGERQDDGKIMDPVDGELYLPSAHPLDHLIDNIFEIVFTRNIAPIFEQMDAASPLPLASSEVRLKRGFYRYIIGQMGIFARFWSISETRIYFKELLRLLEAAATSAGGEVVEVGAVAMTGSETEAVVGVEVRTMEAIDAIRAHYEKFLELLLQKSLISKDDCHNFKDIYPLFEPFYVTYDDPDPTGETYPHLQHLSQTLLSKETHRQLQQKEMEYKFLKKKLTKKEVRFNSRMAMLIESSGGRIEEGSFVIEPGVLLLAHTQQLLNHQHEGRVYLDDGNLNHASFVLAGISLETSLEFIAHHEASIARLTSSKTAAMNAPFYRVQETVGGATGARAGTVGEGADDEESHHHPSNMISYLKLQQMVRTQYEFQEKPMETWQHGIEFFNMTQPGCKATAMVFTMAIKDYHKLFIGRMGESGNENEVRMVVKKMADILHSLYPNQILTSEQYLSLSNGEKYTAPAPPPALFPSLLKTSSSSSPCHLIAETTLTSPGLTLFRNLNIDLTATPCEQIAEFSSRITYLAFADDVPSPHSSKAYLDKMIHEFQHRSIVSAIRVSYLLLLDDLLPSSGSASSTAESHYETFLQSVWKCGGAVTVMSCPDVSLEESRRGKVAILTANLKVLHTLFKEWSKTLPPTGVIGAMMQQAHERYSFAIDSYSVYCD